MLFKIYLFSLVHRRPRGRGDTSKTNWFWKKARNWTSLFSYWMKMLRMEKEENKRQGQMQLVSNPPIKKKNKHVVWRRPPENIWLEVFGPALAMMGSRMRRGRGSAPRYNLWISFVLVFSFFVFRFLLYLNVLVKRERYLCLKRHTIFVVRLNIIQPNAKITNKYDFHESQWTLEHQRDFGLVRACNKLTFWLKNI